MSEKPRIIVLCGTNASGKSGLGVELAERYNGEIVSADSRQVYRGLDLGSGKITPEETKGVRHHLIDVCEPGEFFSMHDFQCLAYAAIDGILARGFTLARGFVLARDVRERDAGVLLRMLLRVRRFRGFREGRGRVHP